MDKLKGYKTIIVAVLMFTVGGLDAIQSTVEVPDWVYGQVYPAIVLVLRFFTTTPILKAKNEKPFVSNQSNLGDMR